MLPEKNRNYSTERVCYETAQTMILEKAVKPFNAS